jgi:predicted ABC-type ATPase
MPLCTVFAGPNGAGKSTALEQVGQAGEFVNADEYARQLAPQNPENASLRAGRRVLGRLSQLIDQGLDFTFETTLSSRQSVAVMMMARQRGYRVELVFIGLRSPELHVARVAQRVAQGGHDIPTRVILRRYLRSFANVPTALQCADSAAFFDNTEPLLVPLARVAAGAVTFTALVRGNSFHERVADAIAEGLGIPPAHVFAPAPD